MNETLKLLIEDYEHKSWEQAEENCTKQEKIDRYIKFLKSNGYTVRDSTEEEKSENDFPTAPVPRGISQNGFQPYYGSTLELGGTIELPQYHLECNDPVSVADFISRDIEREIAHQISIKPGLVDIDLIRVNDYNDYYSRRYRMNFKTKILKLKDDQGNDVPNVYTSVLKYTDSKRHTHRP